MNIIEIHGSKTLYGGASIHTKILSKILSESHRVVLIHEKNNKPLAEASFPNENLKKISLNLFDLSPLNIIKNIMILIKLVKANSIQLIHSHHRKDAIYSAIIKLINPQIKLLHTLHGPILNKRERKIRYKILRLLYIYSLNKLYDSIAFISTTVMADSISLLKSTKRHCVIYNGSEDVIANKNIGEIYSEYNIQRDCFLISWIGELSGYKNPSLIINVATKLKSYKNICFLIVGSGEEQNELEKKVLNKQLTNVIFCGYIKDVHSIINASNIIVSTAIGEGFGRTITEAMMLSKPVIAFNDSGPSEIIINEKTGFLIEPKNIDEYSNAILKLYNNKYFENEMGRNAKILANDKFSDIVFSENYEKEMISIINN